MKSKLASLLSVLLVVFVLAGVAFAMERISTYWTGSLNAGTTSTAFKTQADGGAPALFPAGRGGPADQRDVVIESSATAIEATCCWCLDPSCDVDQVNAAFDGGTGSCMRFPSGIATSFIDSPDYPSLLQTAGVGGQTGICSLPISGATIAAQAAYGGAGDSRIYPPCDADSDCTTVHGISGATCVTAATIATAEDAGKNTYHINKSNVGSYLVCETASSNRRIDAKKQLHRTTP